MGAVGMAEIRRAGGGMAGGISLGAAMLWLGERAAFWGRRDGSKRNCSVAGFDGVTARFFRKGVNPWRLVRNGCPVTWHCCVSCCEWPPPRRAMRRLKTLARLGPFHVGGGKVSW